MLSVSAPKEKVCKPLSEELKSLCFKHIKLVPDKIYKEVSDDDILEIYPQLEKWRLVANHLRLTDPDINGIEGMCKSEEEKRLYMLKKWKEKNRIDQTATYQDAYGGFAEVSLKLSYQSM